jgi:hypothetical protein
MNHSNESALYHQVCVGAAQTPPSPETILPPLSREFLIDPNPQTRAALEQVILDRERGKISGGSADKRGFGV